MARTWKSERHNTYRHAPSWFKRHQSRRRRRTMEQALRDHLHLARPADFVLPRFRREDEWLWW